MSGRLKFKKFNLIPVLLLLAGIFFLGGMTAKAYTLPFVDSSLTINAMGKVYRFYYPEIDLFDGHPYLKNAEEVVDGIFLDTVIRPQDAQIKIYPERENPFEFTKESYGKGIDKEDLLLQIEYALKNGAENITAKEVVLHPKVFVENLQKSTYRRSYFTTTFPYSTEERKHNIALCSKIIGGKIIAPNEEFSFNATVGERTEERGFKGAKIIEDGKFVDGIGGGVCQVSSTVYNAVLLAGLNVTERHSHSMLVSYLEPSFDAMVSGNYADLKFVNNTKSHIFLIAKVEGDSITVSIYGEKPQYTYKRVYETVEKISPPLPSRIPTVDLLIGEEKVSVYPKDGAISKGYLEIYKGNKLIEKRLLSTDKYKPLQGEIYYGEELSKIPQPLNNRLIG
ncbi:MAG: hypothetical protein E7360_06575 [Clostridiales bacterium]|nr:hypothetical protein [Clostridiales bacterium]